MAKKLTQEEECAVNGPHIWGAAGRVAMSSCCRGLWMFSCGWQRTRAGERILERAREKMMSSAERAELRREGRRQKAAERRKIKREEAEKKRNLERVVRLAKRAGNTKKGIRVVDEFTCVVVVEVNHDRELELDDWFDNCRSLQRRDFGSRKSGVGREVIILRGLGVPFSRALGFFRCHGEEPVSAEELRDLAENARQWKLDPWLAPEPNPVHIATIGTCWTAPFVDPEFLEKQPFFGMFTALCPRIDRRWGHFTSLDLERISPCWLASRLKQ